jgi:hypothetical protein
MRIANPDKLNLKGDIFRHTIPEHRKLTLKIMTLEEPDIEQPDL